MSLPSAYNDPELYFRSCVDFLKRYCWIYQNANTCFMKAGVLQEFTAEERVYFTQIKIEDLNVFPLVNNENLKSTPESLARFRAHLKELIPHAAFQEAQLPAGQEFPTVFKKINLKKQHEIGRLAHAIKELCGCSELLIDLGSGLGYLSEILHRTNTGFKILGLEADSQRVITARRRKLEIMPKVTAETIVYKQHIITENSADFISQSASEMLHNLKTTVLPQVLADPVSWSLIGLHACADLSVTSIRLFFSMDMVKRLIIMPCCYHKLEMLTAQTFRNFPLSRSLQNAITADNGAEPMSHYFNRPFLRLACQQTLTRWKNATAEQHRIHGWQLWQRAIAEAILNEKEQVIKRKCKSDGDPADTGSLTFKDLCASYELRSIGDNRSLSWQKRHEDLFDELIRLCPEGAKLAEGLTCLQTSMQKLCENIVLYDRLCYMQEYAASKNLKVTTRYMKLMNEDISPRCYALVAEKIVC